MAVVRQAMLDGDTEFFASPWLAWWCEIAGADPRRLSQAALIAAALPDLKRRLDPIRIEASRPRATHCKRGHELVNSYCRACSNLSHRERYRRAHPDWNPDHAPGRAWRERMGA